MMLKYEREVAAVKRGKTILCAVLTLCMMIPAMVWAVDRLSHLTLTTDAAAVTVGGELTVQVSCGELQVCSYTGGFTFDPAVLEAVSVTMGDAPVYQGGVCGVSTVQEANAAGSVGFYAVHSDPGTYAPGTLLSVTFRVKAPGTAEVRPYEDCDGIETFAGWTGETRVIFTAAPDGTLPGDCNGDGFTNVLDMQYLYTCLADGASAPENADCNGDGTVNILDYQALYEMVRKPAPTVTAPQPALPATETDVATETDMATETDAATPTDAAAKTDFLR